MPGPIPGRPYAIVYYDLDLPYDAEIPPAVTLRFGYDTAAQAANELPAVAAEKGVEEDDCAIIREIREHELGTFTS